MQSFFAKHLAGVLQTTDKDIREMIPQSFRDDKNLETILTALDDTMSKQFDSLSLYEDFLPTIELLKQQ